MGSSFVVLNKTCAQSTACAPQRACTARAVRACCQHHVIVSLIKTVPHTAPSASNLLQTF